ncbi:hypothetical protein LPC10_08370 [Methylorubrum sp. B1-46]|uniref:hypothetical protein n=1 Tax=Methylorubrum sp. B1-46 TaxID=2897334 RepID=UPI001E406FCC|nr:hypothetical protein [Methylorubrum sp. B1-46]UGB27563.1 hypothetical protein LPC10_08370 [Methylorubrum sp. B1-46]
MRALLRPGEKPAPDLTPTEAAAVRRGACQAVQESELADVGTLAPVGAELRELAKRIDTMHEEGRTDG